MIKYIKTFLKGDISSTFLSSAFIQICTILQGIIIARILGPEGRGAFAAIILIPNMIAGISNFGLKTTIARLAANKDKNLLLSIIIISIVTGLLGCLVSFFTVSFFLKNESQEIIYLSKLFSLFVIINHLSINLLSVYHGRSEFKKFNIIRSLINPIYLCMILIMKFMLLFNLENLIFSLIFSNLIVLLITVISFKNIIRFRGKLYISYVLKEGIKLGVVDLFSNIYLYIDKLLLLSLLGSTSLGFYSISLTVSNLPQIICASVATVGFSILANDKKAIQYVINIIRKTFVIYIILAILYSFLIPFLIPLIYGDEFKLSITPALLLLIASFFQGGSLIIEQSLRAIDKPIYGIYSRIYSLFILFVFGYYFSNLYGLIGLCFSIILSQLVFYFSLSYYFKNVFEIEEKLFPSYNDFNKFFINPVKYIKNEK